jgi:hypothetical protein
MEVAVVSSGCLDEVVFADYLCCFACSLYLNRTFQSAAAMAKPAYSSEAGFG